MLIFLYTEAEIAGTVWPAGTRLQAPEKAALEAIAAGVAGTDPPQTREKEAKAEPSEPAAEPKKKRGRPAKS